MTLATQHAEIDRVLLKHFDVHHCTDVTNPEGEFDLDAGLGLCFEFDYPDRPGLELMRATKERLPHVPILMVTTEGEFDRISSAIEEGANEYVIKPFDKDILRTKLEAVGLEMTVQE